jgi:hypothetical protein
VFGNRVLRRIFGPKREEVAGGWRKLHEEIHNLYASPNIIRVFRSRRVIWAGHVARMGQMRNAFIILVEKPEARRPLGSPKGIWEDNMRMRFREVGWEAVDWIPVARDRHQ